MAGDKIIRAAADAIAVYRGSRRSRTAWVEAEAIVAAIEPLLFRAAADAIENSSDAKTCTVKRTCHEADVWLLRRLADDAEEAGDH